MTVIHFWLIYSCLILGTGILCDHKLERRQASTRCSKTSKNTFSCSDGQCIVWSSVCDGREDCSDGSDENKEMCNRYEYGTSKIECGRVYNTSNSVSSTNDMKKLIGRAPWTVGIYVKDMEMSHYIYVCAGSIIGPKQIVSVAQCLWDSDYMSAKISIKNNFKVAIGKYLKSYYTHFETVDNEFTQIMDVESVYAHENFYDTNKQVIYDIAVVVLSKKITFSDYVTPVCIDWSGKYTVRNGSKGQIITWKFGEESSLSETSLSYIDSKSCQKTYGFGPTKKMYYLADDKFCGSSEMGQIVQIFYFGAGLTFAHSNNSHFLTGAGLYSTDIENENRTVVDFTDIKYHINWIRNIYIKYLDHDIPFCILPAVDGVIYSYEGSNEILAHGTLINQYRTVIENCDVGYYKAYPRGLRVCQGNGKWSSTFEKLCIKMCPPLLSDSLDIKCTLNGKFTNCSNPSTPETIAVPSCKPTHTLPNGQEETPIELICQSDGMWDNQLYKCNPHCGRVYTNGKILIANGKKAQFGTAPWNVGIYRLNKANSNYDLICGGTIISSNLVVTAAHCFWYKGILSKKISINDDSYKVAVGKYDRNFTVVDNDFTRIMNVGVIYLHDLFTGNQDYYAYDIAVMVLSNIVSFSNVVAPICIDWTGKYNVSNGVEGKIVGWGNTEKGTLSPVLLETSLPYLDHDSCRAMYTNGFHIFVTLDKFCAGSASVPGQDMGEGDSGSGLTFLHSKSYYLTGVLSLKQPSSNNSIALFTDFKHHIQWIRRLYQKHN